jgi:nucleotide-binding universal stress UspA family protein
MKSILALAAGSPRLEATLATAALAARRLEARLTGLHIRADAELLAFYSGESPLPGSASRSAVLVADREARARAVFDKAVAGLPASATRWRGEKGREAELLAGFGRAADLVVIGRAGDDTAPESVSGALFETGRPVLVAPPAPPTTIGTAVSIAWNDSVQAARAVGTAVRLIAPGASVRVLVAVRGGEQAPTAALLDYLACWGIAAVVEAFDPGSGSARARGRGLLRRAQEGDADLLVMGAYGQGRMMQLLGLGGATAKVITANTMPVLLAH